MSKTTSENKVNGKTSPTGFYEGTSRCLRQTQALTYKNLLLQGRNLKASFAVYLSSFVLLFTLYLSGIPINNLWKDGLPQSRDDPSPTAYPIERFKCSPNMEAETAEQICYQFVMVGNTTHDRAIAKNIQSIVGAKGENENAGWIAVKDRDEFHSWTILHKNKSRIGIQMLWPLDGVYSTTLNVYNPTVDEISYIVHYNESKNCITGWIGCEERQRNKIAAWQLIVDSALVRMLAKKEGKTPYEAAEIKASIKSSPHPENNFVEFDMFNYAGKDMLLIAVMFNFVVQAYQMSREKELKLPEMLSQMGMDHRAYYMSWVITHTITNVIQALLIVSFGYILNFNLFIKTDFSILFFTMFLPCMSFTALAFLISAFFRKGLDASNVCLVVFLLAYNAADILSALIFESGEETENFWKWFFTYLPIGNAPISFLSC